MAEPIKSPCIGVCSTTLGNLGSASATPELARQCKRNLEEYKKRYPEEYKEVFGEDDSIGSSCNPG